MAIVHLPDGEKGGVGKSWLTTMLAKYYADYGIPFYLVAADRSNPTVINRYKDKARYKEFYEDSIRFIVFSESEKRQDAPDDLFEWAIERPVVIDLPAQVHRPFANWITNKNVLAHAKDYGVEFCKWFVCDGEDDSIHLFIQSLKFYQNEIPHVLVKNWGRCDDWEYFDEHEELQTMLEQYNVPVIDFPKLSDGKRIKMNARRWTFDEALESPEFKILARQDIQTYLKKAYAALESAGVLP